MNRREALQTGLGLTITSCLPAVPSQAVMPDGGYLISASFAKYLQDGDRAAYEERERISAKWFQSCDEDDC